MTTPVEALSSTGAVIHTGTAFFYGEAGNDVLLITNWHVVTDRFPKSPRLGRTGAVPVKLRMRCHTRLQEKAISLTQKTELLIDINDENGESPNWLEHPTFRFKVDLVALPIAKRSLERVTYQTLTSYKGFQADFNPEVMTDVFVVGYPWGLTGGDDVLPLYKRGSVASEPLVANQGLPRFLIDCRTAAGMSGAPVICTHSGLWAPSGTMDGNSVIGTVSNFAGVYSGRLEVQSEKDEADGAISEIGVVWRADAVAETAAGVPGSRLSTL